MSRSSLSVLVAASAAMLFGGAALADDGAAQSVIRSGVPKGEASEAFERDRRAILEMAGDYRVHFDFIETVAFDPAYELRERDTSGGTEMVRVLADDGDFISLQHTLVMTMEGAPVPIVVKHWRQDWRYEPATVMQYQGRDLWLAEDVAAQDRAGAWSQTVYQVDDSLRYGAVASWRHEGKVSTWEPERSLRPLPRRDGTTRDDYDLIAGINRHTVTPGIWWHEQDNAKKAFDADGALVERVREVAVNTYRADDDFSPAAGEEYWAKTGAFWAEVRGLWAEAEATGRVAVHDNAEGEFLYIPMLELAEKVGAGALTAQDAAAQARDLMARQVQTGEAARQTAAVN